MLPGDKREQALKTGLIIKTKTRSDIFSSKEQGKIVLFGNVYTFKTENLSGGLWRIYIDY